MQRYSHEDPFEREPLEYSSPSYNNSYDSSSYPSAPTPAPAPPPHGSSHGSSHGYSQNESPYLEYYDASPSSRHVAANPDYNRVRQQDNYSRPSSPLGGDYNVADQSPRHAGASQLPPPPSRSLYPNMPQQAYSPHSTNSFGYESGGNLDHDSHTSLTGLGGAAAAVPVNGQAPGRGPNFHSTDSYINDRYQAYSSRIGNDPHLEMFNPNEIEDDGDDGLQYHKQSQRNSVLSFSNSDRGTKPAIGAAAAVGGATAAGGVLGGLLGRKGKFGSGTCENVVNGEHYRLSWRRRV